MVMTDQRETAIEMATIFETFRCVTAALTSSPLSLSISLASPCTSMMLAGATASINRLFCNIVECQVHVVKQYIVMRYNCARNFDCTASLQWTVSVAIRSARLHCCYMMHTCQQTTKDCVNKFVAPAKTL
jgi:hypothetical protein